MADSSAPPPPRGDEAQLFREFNDDLMRLVNSNVHSSSPQTVEDACAFAWTKFMEHQPDRDQNWRGWLFRTAQREAWAIERALAAVRDPADNHARFGYGPGVAPSAFDDMELQARVEDAISILRGLPERLQHVAMLRALGFRYRDIEEITGHKHGRVKTLVVRAGDHVHDVLEARAAEEPHPSPRAARLAELERDQPAWLLKHIGAFPRHARSDNRESVRRRSWRRAALALDDYRNALGTEEVPDLSERQKDPTLQWPAKRAQRAVAELQEWRSGGRDLDR